MYVGDGSRAKVEVAQADATTIATKIFFPKIFIIGPPFLSPTPMSLFKSQEHLLSRINKLLAPAHPPIG